MERNHCLATNGAKGHSKMSISRESRHSLNHWSRTRGKNEWSKTHDQKRKFEGLKESFGCLCACRRDKNEPNVDEGPSSLMTRCAIWQKRHFTQNDDSFNGSLWASFAKMKHKASQSLLDVKSQGWRHCTHEEYLFEVHVFFVREYEKLDVSFNLESSPRFSWYY